MSTGANDDAVPRSIGRVLDLLEIVLAEGECTLTEAAINSGLTPTTALRHLRALDARGYVSRNADGVFSAGPTLYRITSGLRSDGPIERLIHVARPFLDKLASDTGESTYLALGDGRTTATYIAMAAGTHAIRHVGWVGQHVTLRGAAVGAAFEQIGIVASRTGAVEADITAISLALPPHKSLDVAVSVLGPEHRMRGNERVIRQSLEGAVQRIADDLGLTQEAAAS